MYGNLFLKSFYLKQLIQQHQICIIQQCAMIHCTIAMYALRTARDFSPVDINTQSFVASHCNSGGSQHFNRSLQISFETRQTGSFNERKIDVAQIVIYGTATGKPPEYRNLVLFRHRPVHFRFHPLMLAYNYGRSTLPKHEYIFCTLLQQILFSRQIETGIRKRAIYKPHQANSVS